MMRLMGALAFASLAGCAEHVVGGGADGAVGVDAAADRSEVAAHDVSAQDVAPDGRVRARLGADCTRDDDCESGRCLSITDFDDGCAGRFCSQPCVTAPSCAGDPSLGTADCETVRNAGGSFCLWSSLEARFCR